MSSLNNRKARRSRHCLRNEKFSRFLRKKPRRDMSPYRISYLRQFNLKECNSSGLKVYHDYNAKTNLEILFNNKLRSKSEGMRSSLLPVSNLTGWGHRFYMKKVLCHKLKKKIQNQNKRDRIKQDVMKKVQLFKSFSEKKGSLNNVNCM